MKKTYTAPELLEIKIEDVITASKLTQKPSGKGEELDYADL